MKRILTSLTAGAIAMTAVVAVAQPASADDGWVEQRVWTTPAVQPDINDPGGHVKGYLNFTSRYTMNVEKVTLDDICPGDGHSVYWQLRVEFTNGTYYMGPKHWSEGTCGSANEYWSSLPFETNYNQIKKAALKVCVNTDEGDGGIFDPGDSDACNYTRYRDNNYT